MLTKKLNPLRFQILAEYYGGEKLISVHGAGGGFLAANERILFNENPRLRNSEQLMLISVFDNLGKGASGARWGMNIALGLYEFETLI